MKLVPILSLNVRDEFFAEPVTLNTDRGDVQLGYVAKKERASVLVCFPEWHCGHDGEGFLTGELSRSGWYVFGGDVLIDDCQMPKEIDPQVFEDLF